MSPRHRLSLRLIALFFLLTMACNSVFDGAGILSDQAPTPTPVSWPQTRLDAPQHITPVSIGGQTQYVFTRQVANVAAMRNAPQLDTAQFPRILTYMPEQQPLLPVGQPVQIDTTHTSPNNIAAIELAINGLPVVPDEARFPSSHVRVEVCTNDVWLKTGLSSYAEFCAADGLIVTPRYEPPAGFHEKKISLVVTGRQPGLYRLTITTIDGGDETGTPGLLSRLLPGLDITTDDETGSPGNRRQVDQLLEFVDTLP